MNSCEWKAGEESNLPTGAFNGCVFLNGMMSDILETLSYARTTIQLLTLTTPTMVWISREKW